MTGYRTYLMYDGAEHEYLIGFYQKTNQEVVVPIPAGSIYRLIGDKLTRPNVRCELTEASLKADGGPKIHTPPTAHQSMTLTPKI